MANPAKVSYMWERFGVMFASKYILYAPTDIYIEL